MPDRPASTPPGADPNPASRPAPSPASRSVSWPVSWPARFRPSRRGFLIGSGAALGLVVGYAVWPRRYPGGWVAGAGETLLGPWVKIGAGGRVTVAVPQAEMGQGVFSAFAQIVADELGADWSMMAVEPAPFHPAYANIGLAREAAAGLPSPLRGLAEYLGAEAIRRFNVHMTAGSNSVRNYEPLLRAAAAEARQRLIAAAAKQWGVSASLPDTLNGAVVYKANRMAFAEAVALVDAAADPPAAKLRAPEARLLVGRALPRIDLPPKVDGSARFGADVRLPDMVYAAIRHGPVGGRLERAAAADTVLAGGVVLVEGPNWVATSGITNWEARRALAAVEAEFVVDGRAAGPWIEEELLEAARAGDGGGKVAGHGDVEGPLAAESGVVVAEYRLPFLAHASLEPMTATARVLDDQVEVWGPTQSLTVAHERVAAALGVDDSLVVVHPTLVGGGFGRNIEADAMVEAVLIARAVGKPVQLTWSREEDLGSDQYRPPVAARLRGAVKDGAIAAFEARVAAPSLGASFLARNFPALAPAADKPSAREIEGLDRIPYRTAAFRAVHVPLLQPAPLGYWRSVGHSFSAFVVESFLDELAEAAAADPLEFRLRLLDGKPRHQKVLRAVAAATGWGDETAGAAVAPGFARGLALAEGFGSVVATVVTAGVVDGQVRIAGVTSAIDCGPVVAPDGVRAQVEGANVMGLSAALHEAVTFEDGEARERNFDSYRLARMADLPSTIEVVLVESEAALGGVGEAGVPPAAPALANALARATGKRARTLPLAGFYES